jgi:hypothetical protein
LIPNFLKLADRSITILGEGGSALAKFLSDHFSNIAIKNIVKKEYISEFTKKLFCIPDTI